MAHIYPLICIYVILQTLDARNCRSGDGIHIFGVNCDFICHCKNNDKCDVTSGECVSGCARGWFGPGCQYRDLAAHGRVQEIRKNAGFATDGDLTTCSDIETSYKIQFNATEIITEIHIVTKSDKLLTVEHKETNRECYRHGNVAPKSEQIILFCYHRLIGNQVTIQLERSQKQVLCDLKINGGRNLAFKRNASQISVNSHCTNTCTAEKAVDGHGGILSWNQCSFTGSEDNPWWKVDLGYEARIQKIQIVTGAGERPNAIEVSNITHISEMDHNDVEEDVGLNVIGRFIKVARRENNKRIMICELYVYGDCLENMCGYDCKKTCHCQKASILDRIYGNCLIGCKDGWRGSQCDIPCAAGTYGTNCEERCSKQCKGRARTCNHITGHCLLGCTRGWTGQLCKDACRLCYFGNNCSQRCSDHCEGGNVKCRNSDGSCSNGCQAGWKGKQCDSECINGTYGKKCSRQCPSNCKDGVCDKVNGRCLQCKPSYQGDTCGYVYSKPSVPEFSNVVSADYCHPGGCILANLNKLVAVECFVQGGSEPIDLNMLKNGKTITNASKTQNEINSITFNYVKYNFTPTKLDVENTVILTCTVENPALSVLTSSSIMLYVKVAPEKIEAKPIEVVESMQSEVQCIETNARPPMKANLFINTTEEHNTIMKAEMMPGNLYTITTSTTQIFNRFQNQLKVTCCSSVDSQMCGEIKINVLFPPNNISVEEISKQNRENGDSIIQVKVIVAESNPKSSVKVTGVKHTQQALVHEIYEQKNDTHGWILSEIWSFNFTGDDNKREITFETVTEGFPNQTLHFIYKINITYYPIVTILGPNTVYLGNDVILACHVNSNPPSTLLWYNQTDFIKEIYGAKTFNLYLPNISTNHSQTYICMANNGIGGMKSKVVTLIVKDPSKILGTAATKSSTESSIASVIGPIIGSIIAVIIIAIIVGFLIHKRRRRNTSLERRNLHHLAIVGNDINVTRQRTHEMKVILPVHVIDETNVYSEIGTDYGGYECLNKQGISKESDLYTELECHSSIVLPSEDTNVMS